MRHGIAGRKLSIPTDQRLALYRNLVTDLLRHEKIVTTEAKAKAIRPFAERMISLGKQGDLHKRRQAAAFIYDEKVVQKVFNELKERYASRPGGYTRTTKLGPRQGDGAAMVQIELVP